MKPERVGHVFRITPSVMEHPVNKQLIIPAVGVEVAAIKALVGLVAVCFEDFRSPYQKGGDCLGLERYQTLTKNPNHYNNRQVTEK